MSEWVPNGRDPRESGDSGLFARGGTDAAGLFDAVRTQVRQGMEAIGAMLDGAPGTYDRSKWLDALDQEEAQFLGDVANEMAKDLQDTYGEYMDLAAQELQDVTDSLSQQGQRMTDDLRDQINSLTPLDEFDADFLEALKSEARPEQNLDQMARDLLSSPYGEALDPDLVNPVPKGSIYDGAASSLEAADRAAERIVRQEAEAATYSWVKDRGLPKDGWGKKIAKGLAEIPFLDVVLPIIWPQEVEPGYFDDMWNEEGTFDNNEPIDLGDCKRWPNAPHCKSMLSNAIDIFDFSPIDIEVFDDGCQKIWSVNVGISLAQLPGIFFGKRDPACPMGPPEPDEPGTSPVSPSPYLPDLPPPQTWTFDAGDCTRSLTFVYVDIWTRIWSAASRGEIQAIPGSLEGRRERLSVALSKAVGATSSRENKHSNSQFWYNPDAAPVTVSEVGGRASIIFYNPAGTVSTIGKTTLAIPQDDGSIQYREMGLNEQLTIGSGRLEGTITFPDSPTEFDPGFEGFEVVVTYRTRIIQGVYACPVRSTELGPFYRLPSGPELYSYLSGTGIAIRWPGPTIQCQSGTCNAPAPPQPNPLPRKPPPMSCCPKTDRMLALLLKEIKELREEETGPLHARYVGSDWGSDLGEGIEVPSSLLTTEDDNDDTTEVRTWPQLFLWFVRQFDSLAGEWPIEIEIEQPEPGKRPVTIKLANISECLAEIYGISTSIEVDADASVAFLLRLASESVQSKVMLMGLSDYVRAITDYLDFPGKEVARDLALNFTGFKLKADRRGDVAADYERTQDVRDVLKNSVVQVRGYQFNNTEDTLTDAMQKLLYAAAIIKAVHVRSPEPGEPGANGRKQRDMLETIGDIASIIGAGASVAKLFDKDGNEITMDWEQFLKDLNDPNSLLNRGQPAPSADSRSTPNPGNPTTSNPRTP